jgi:hypothetical protein
VALEADVQRDFSAGSFPGVSRDEIPRNGVEHAVNCLIADEGDLYRRGGGTWKSTAFAAADLRYIWDGYVSAGRRTFISGPGTHGVIAADDVTPISLSVAGMDGLYKPAAAEGLLVLPGGKLWGGSRQSGTLSVVGEVITAVNGNAVIQTANPPTTPWTAAAVEPGTMFSAQSGVGDRLWYPVKTLDTNYKVTLARAYRGASFVDFINFTFQPFGQLSRTGNIFLAIANRLLACEGNIIYESALGNIQDFTDTAERLELPAGVEILGAEAFRDTGVIFTTQGVWAIYNLSYRLTDPAGNTQQRLEQISRDLILWSWPGVVNTGADLIVPARDGIYIFNPTSGARKITGGMAVLYRSYVEAGYRAGYATVFDGTYFLPIIDAGNNVVNVLTCRLSETIEGVTFGWTQHTPDYAAFTQRGSEIMAADVAEDRIATLDWLNPISVHTDPDDADYAAEIQTREMILPNGVENFLERVRVTYELDEPGSVDADYVNDAGSYSNLTPVGDAGDPSTLLEPRVWLVRKRGYGRTLRFEVTGGARFVLHKLEAFFRRSGKQ